MGKVSTYLNFMGNAEEAFNFYKAAFNSGFTSLTRFKDMPTGPNSPSLIKDELEKIMHIELPILDGHLLMATDMLASMGHSLRVGNNITINIQADTLEEVETLFAKLSEGGSEISTLQQMPWGTWGTCLDRFGIRWMFNFPR